MDKVGLVLEGGGMRGVYTCGVLEYFLSQNLHFKYCVGVSAGASNAASYIARQKGRNEKVTIGFVNDKRYMSFRNLITTKSFFGMDFIFNEIPNNLVPFDYETFNESDCNYLIGVTDCNTGKAIYLNKDDVKGGLQALRATCSLPLISPVVNFKGYELLDGGISDSIPIAKSIMDGNDKNIIVLTRNKEYRKKPTQFVNLIKYKYKKYPLLVEALINRHRVYNETLDYIEKLEAAGKAIVIRPTKTVTVGRLEKDITKLKELYNMGMEDARVLYDRIKEFIELK